VEKPQTECEQLNTICRIPISNSELQFLIADTPCGILKRISMQTWIESFSFCSPFLNGPE
jgi:hypothetical protein